MAIRFPYVIALAAVAALAGCHGTSGTTSPLTNLGLAGGGSIVAQGGGNGVAPASASVVARDSQPGAASGTLVNTNGSNVTQPAGKSEQEGGFGDLQEPFPSASSMTGASPAAAASATADVAATH